MTAIVMGAYDYGGGALTGYKKDRDVDEFERKEQLRKNRRRPIEETIQELGEGRGKKIWMLEKHSTNHVSQESTRQGMMREEESG